MYGKIQGDWDPRNTGLAVQLRIAEGGGSTVVEDVEESLGGYNEDTWMNNPSREDTPRGFFLRARKTVSMSSTYLKK